MLLPGAYLAWLVALGAGLAYVSFLDWLCPPELLVSGACTASWHGPAVDAGIAGGAALAAGLIMVTVVLLAPSHRRLVAVAAFAIGSAVALYMAHHAHAWAAGASAIAVGLIALLLGLRTLP